MREEILTEALNINKKMCRWCSSYILGTTWEQHRFLICTGGQETPQRVECLLHHTFTWPIHWPREWAGGHASTAGPGTPKTTSVNIKRETVFTWSGVLFFISPENLGAVDLHNVPCLLLTACSAACCHTKTWILVHTNPQPCNFYGTQLLHSRTQCTMPPGNHIK
jgi:hypothetical protein